MGEFAFKVFLHVSFVVVVVVIVVVGFAYMGCSDCGTPPEEELQSEDAEQSEPTHSLFINGR